MTVDELMGRMTSAEFSDWQAYFMLESGGYLPKKKRKSPKDLYQMLRDWAKLSGARDGRE